MKIESRGKYPGVKVHLEPEEVNIILDYQEKLQQGFHTGPEHPAQKIEKFEAELAKKIKKLKEEEPGLLQERTPEQIKAILAKESEKAALQLAALNAGKTAKDYDPDKLKEALLKHAH